MSLTKEQKYTLIRTKYDNNSATIEELAELCDIDLYTVTLLVNNALEHDTKEEFVDSSYDARVNKCLKCGSSFDQQGIPTNCMGDCEQEPEDYIGDCYLGEADNPIELNFED